MLFDFFSVKFCCIRENVVLSTACSRLTAYLFLITLCICRLQMFYFLSRDATICIARCVPSTLFVCPLCSYNVSNGSTQWQAINAGCQWVRGLSFSHTMTTEILTGLASGNLQRPTHTHAHTHWRPADDKPVVSWPTGPDRGRDASGAPSSRGHFPYRTIPLPINRAGGQVPHR